METQAASSLWMNNGKDKSIMEHSQAWTQQINAISRFVQAEAKRQNMSAGSRYLAEQAKLRRDELVELLISDGPLTANEIAKMSEQSINTVRHGLSILGEENRVTLHNCYPRKWSAK